MTKATNPIAFYMYRALVIVLGINVSFVLHALIEIPLLYLSTSVYNSSPAEFYGGYWDVIHASFGIGLLVGGVIGGVLLGGRWWHRVYEANV